MNETAQEKSTGRNEIISFQHDPIIQPKNSSLQEQASDSLLATLERLEQWLIRHEYRGWDPHDALTSPLIKAMTRKSRLFGIVCLQFFKRSPINLRPFFGIKQAYNAKAMGLFLQAYIHLHLALDDETALDRSAFFADWISRNSVQGYHGACWGYNFDWPNRRFYAPAGTPNVVTTAFIGHALLEYYRLTGAEQWAALAASACDFIIHDLNRIEKDDLFAFSYTPLDDRCVHNANMLASSLLACVAEMTGKNEYADNSVNSMRFSLASQQDDGSWFYGEHWTDRWIDSYHTGYSLVALKRFIDARNDNFGQEELIKGIQFYRRMFFSDNGTIKYYHDNLYPVESHAFAHALIALQELHEYIEDADSLSDRVFERCVDLLCDPKGYFYYRRSRFYTNKIPYMRWVQAWMFLALSKRLAGKKLEIKK